MDPNKSSSHGDYGVSPPPYTSSYPGGGYQVSTMANSLGSFGAIFKDVKRKKASRLTCVLMSGGSGWAWEHLRGLPSGPLRQRGPGLFRGSRRSSAVRRRST